MQRWRGLKSLIIDAVDGGSRAVERVHLETARLPFEILEQIPPIAAPVKGIHLIHDTTVAGVHGMIRLVNRVTGKTLDVVLDVVEDVVEKEAKAQGAPAPAEGEGAPTEGEGAPTEGEGAPTEGEGAPTGAPDR
jgi:hypothetical protein